MCFLYAKDNIFCKLVARMDRKHYYCNLNIVSVIYCTAVSLSLVASMQCQSLALGQALAIASTQPP